MGRKGVGFAIFRTTTNELTDANIDYPSISASTEQTLGTSFGDFIYELVYSWPE